jgi:hypothetical protein
MLPSTNATSTASRLTRNVPPVRAEQLAVAEQPVVFRVIQQLDGGWRLEKSGGDVGGLFTSKHAALSYACGQAEWCGSSTVLIELREQAQTRASNH